MNIAHLRRAQQAGHRLPTGWRLHIDTHEAILSIRARSTGSWLRDLLGPRYLPAARVSLITQKALYHTPTSMSITRMAEVLEAMDAHGAELLALDESARQVQQRQQANAIDAAIHSR